MALTNISGTLRPVVRPTLVRALCMRPYPGHPNGCPNYGRRLTCPPQTPLIDKMLNLEAPVYFVATIFPLAEHVARMRAKHPAWSDRQCACCLYWQGAARRRLRLAVNEWTLHRVDFWRILWVPEANGVDVTASLAAIGVQLEWPPRTVAYQVVLIGTPRGMDKG